MTIIAQTRGGAISSLDDVDVLTRILNAGHSVLFYCQKWLLPTALSPVYPFPDPFLKGELSAWLELAIVLGFTVVTIVLARRGHRGWLAAWLIYIVGLLPALGLIQVGIQAAADRYTYIPMVGLAIAAGAGAVGLAVNLPSAFSRVAHGGLVAAIVLGLVLATRVQSEMWHDDRILWTNALSIYPAQIPIAHINLGNTYVMSGEREIAIQHYKNALRVDPDNVVAHTNLAWSHAHLNQFDEALAYANGAIEIDKDSVLGWLARGLSLHVTGQRASAIDAYEMVLNLDPSNGDAATNRDNLIHGQSLATPHRAPTD
jgi:protein O-mannosyl-transferase